MGQQFDQLEKKIDKTISYFQLIMDKIL